MKFTITFLICYVIFALQSSAQLGAWVPVGNLNANQAVNILLKGNSGELYAAGRFTDANGRPYVAKWDGTSWAQVGDALGFYPNQYEMISALAQDNAGNLYAAGTMKDTFNIGNPWQNTFCYVAKWDGTKWTKLGIGTNQAARTAHWISSLTTDNAGNVYAAGDSYDGNGDYCVMKWDGSTWSKIGSTGIKQVLNDGISGVKIDQSGYIYITGYFSSVTSAHSSLYMWNGSAWTRLGTEQTGGWTNSSLVLNSSGTPYADVSQVSRWNGSTWSPLGTNSLYGPLAIDNANNIYASTFYGVAKWNGTSWSAVGTNNNAFPNTYSIVVNNSGSVFVTGPNTKKNNIYYVTMWDPNAVAEPVVTSIIYGCQNVTAAPLTATGTNLQWYTTPTGGLPSSSAPVPNTSNVGNTVYYVSQTINGIEGPRAEITVNVRAISPPPVVTPAVNYCQNATAVPLSVSAPATSLIWSSQPVGGYEFTAYSGLTPLTTNVGITTYYVGQNTTGCYSPKVSITVTVNPIPAAPTVTSPISICQNSVATALAATGNSLLWYTVPTDGTSSSSAPVPSVITVGTSTYYVSQTLNGCTSTRASIDVNVDASPSTPAVTSPLNYCLNDIPTALSASGNSLLWYTSSSGAGSTSIAPVPSTTSDGTSTYYVSQTVNGCTSSFAAIDVIITAPTMPVVTSPVNYCLNDVPNSLTATGSSLLWYTVPTGGTASSSAPTPSTAAEGTSTYYVSQTLYGCISEYSSIDVTVNSIPVVLISPGSDALICNSGGFVTLTSSTGNLYEWKNGTTTVGANQTYNASTAGSYTVTVTDALGCTGTSDALLVSQSLQSCYDCAGVLNGTALLDDCDVCTGGTTGLSACTTTSTSLGLSDEKTIVIFPQPFTSTTRIQLENGASILAFSVYNSSGIIETTKSDLNSNEIEIGEDLKAGIYFVLIQTGQGNYMTKISKLK